MIGTVLVYRRGFSSEISQNTLGLLKQEQKQAAEVLFLGHDVVAIVPTSAQTLVNTSVFW